MKMIRRNRKGNVRGRRMRGLMWAAALAVAVVTLAGCGGRDEAAGESSAAQSTSTAAQRAFDVFCGEVFREEMEDADTLDLHYTLQNPAAYGIEPGDASLGTYSLTEMISDNRGIRELLGRLWTHDRAELTADQQITYDALEETLRTSLSAEGLELYEQPLAPTIGVQAQLPILLAEYAFDSAADIEDYLEILSQIDRYYGEILTFEQQKADAGLGPSDASIDAIVESCRSYLIDPEENFLTETFDARLKELDARLTGTASEEPLSEKQKMDYRARHNAVIREHFLPAYQMLIEGMKAFRGRGINDGGLVHYKDGREYYEYLVACGPGLSLSVDELKDTLRARMQEDYEEIQELSARYPGLETRAQTAQFSLTDPEEILEDLKIKMQADFPDLGGCDYEIRYVPKYLESSLSPAFYLTAPLDDTDRNVIYINNGSTDASGSRYTTLAHEGFPGHLYQTVYSRRHADTPLRAILSCSGTNEGWATYVEDYASMLDNGLPDGVGAYRARLRSFSLCVHSLLDIGINYDGWAKAQTAEFVGAFFEVDEGTVDMLWQTMIDNPANYLEYCGGYIEIMEMRDEAETALGEKFSLREFHTFLLDVGPVSFPVMRRSFEQWLRMNTAS